MRAPRVFVTCPKQAELITPAFMRGIETHGTVARHYRTALSHGTFTEHGTEHGTEHDTERVTESEGT
ncbi:MAG: hypothetical protein AAF662_04785 [Pseudomonadota bacterium]